MKLIFGNVQIFWDSAHRHLFHSKNICPLLFLTSSSTYTLLAWWFENLFVFQQSSSDPS
jgi:hypothetical protein